MQLKEERPATTEGRERPMGPIASATCSSRLGTGGFAKQVALRSLYRLDRRGLRGSAIVGVAVDEWTTYRLRQHFARGRRGLRWEGLRSI